MIRKFISGVLLASMTVSAFSQNGKDQIDLYMSVFGNTKKAIVSDFIDLEGYAKAYMILTAPRTDEIIKDLATQKKNLDELIFKYYKKMSKTVGIKPAAEFYQIENYSISTIRLEIFKNIFFIGEN